MTIQDFFSELVSRTALPYQDLITGIGDFHQARGWISERQGAVVRTNASKAGMELHDDLVIGDPRDKVPEPSNTPCCDPDYVMLPSNVDCTIKAGELVVIHNRRVVGVWRGVS